MRLQILNLVAARPKTIAEIAKELRLHRMTLRYHLSLLLSQGLVEEVKPSGDRKVGRPATLYLAKRHPQVTSFPQRHFDLLGEIALRSLVDAVGEEVASAQLREKGVYLGRSLIEEQSARANIDRWTPEAFERLVVEGLYRDFGMTTEIVSRGPRSLTYKSFNCPFLELAEKFPNLICNALDEGFHTGIGTAAGGARTERLACMGHGDPFCQYKLTWRSRSRPPRSREDKAGGGKHV